MQQDIHATGQIAIRNEEFNQLIEEEIKYIEHYFVSGKKKSLMPWLHVYTRSNYNKPLSQTIVAFGDLPYGEERYNMMKGLGIKFFQDRKNEGGHAEMPVALVMTSEIWMKKMKNDEPMPKGVQVHDYDDKTEGVAIFAMTLDNRTAAAFFDVQRNTKKQMKIKLGRKNLFDPEKSTGIESYLLRAFYEGFTMAIVAEKGVK